jgi:hypothetical protein
MANVDEGNTALIIFDRGRHPGRGGGLRRALRA